MPDSKELRAQRADIWEQMKALQDRAEGENRDFDEEEKAAWNKADADLESLSTRIARQEVSEKREREVAFEEITSAKEGDFAPGSVEEVTRAYSEAFEAYIRSGVGRMDPEKRQVLETETRKLASKDPEFRAQTITTTGGGYLIPQGFYRQLQEAQKAFGGMRQASFVFQTDSGQPLPIPTLDDTSNVGELLSINTQAATQDLTFGQVTLGAYMFSSKVVLVPLQLLQDSAFDVNALLARKLGERIGRIQNTKFTTGTATVEPQGVVAGATSAGTTASGQTASVIYNDFVNLEHSIDPAYRANPGTRWMMADATVKSAKLLKDSQGRPLWVPGIATAEPDTILGYPYTINQDVAVPAGSAKFLLFGDFGNYWIRDVIGITLFRFEERFMEFLQVGFLAYARADGAVIDAGTHPIKFWVNSAS